MDYAAIDAETDAEWFAHQRPSVQAEMRQWVRDFMKLANLTDAHFDRLLAAYIGDTREKAKQLR